MRIITGCFLLLSLTVFTNSCANKSEAAEKTVTISLPSAKCETCKKTIEKALLSTTGVENAIVSTNKPKVVQVVYNNSLTSEQKICEAISKAGYVANTTPRDEAAYDKLDDCCK